jgi:uncharacterized protein (DUF342 family)
MTPPQTTAPERVHILSRAFDSWVVEFRIAVSELLDQQQLLHHLRGVKQVIAETQSVSESCLVFDGILRKSREDEWVDVVVRIKKRIVESGAPRVTFRDERSVTGTTYSHMHALLDICYLDEFEQVVTLERIQRAIRDAGIAPDLVDHAMVAQKLAEVIDSQIPARAVPVAAGRLPDIGRDAEIQFYFQATADSQDLDLLYSSRRVTRGDLLCHKNPPSEGQHAGQNVLGQGLPPRAGLDINVVAGANAARSLDNLDIVAEADGVVEVQRVYRQIHLSGRIKEIPESVTVKVNPLLRLEANEVVDVATSSAVEVLGNLRVGSRIVSDSEVYVSGDVETGASVTAADDILVKGAVDGATLSSQHNIHTGRSVANSQIHAQGDVTIDGDVHGSNVSGDRIRGRTATGSRFVARRGVTLDRVGADEGGVMSTICVGMQEFFKQRLVENRQFLEMARANLERIQLIIGEDLFERVDNTNVQTILMRFLARLHLDSNSRARQQVDVYRKLIESVPPTRALIAQKKRECEDIARKLSEPKTEGDGMIIVNERIASPTIVSVNGFQGHVGASSAPVHIESNGEEVVVKSDCTRPTGPTQTAGTP